MTYKNKLNSLVERVSARLALLLLGGVLFVGCGKGDNGGNGGNEAAAGVTFDKSQQDKAKENSVLAIMHKLGLSGSTESRDILSKAINGSLALVNEKDTGKGCFKDAGAAAPNDDKRAISYLYQVRVREALKKFVADPKDSKKVNERNFAKGLVRTAVDKFLSKEVFKVDGFDAKGALTVESTNDCTDLCTKLEKENSDNIWLPISLVEHSVKFCDALKDPSKYKEEDVVGIIDGVRGLKKEDAIKKSFKRKGNFVDNNIEGNPLEENDISSGRVHVSHDAVKEAVDEFAKGLEEIHKDYRTALLGERGSEKKDAEDAKGEAKDANKNKK